jgi:hypothetical protein
LGCSKSGCKLKRVHNRDKKRRVCRDRRGHKRESNEFPEIPTRILLELLEDRDNHRFIITVDHVFINETMGFMHRLAKGKPVNIPAPGCGFCAATQLNVETLAGYPGRLLFSS